ncbi:MAG: hypothetical protein GQ549_00135 [Gammaproteobacteria bacterium]|nr:hypothetical protein [Gammaproteobacteria bacterium]
MLSDDELGAFILVLANSHQDEYLRDELRDDLRDTYIALKDNYISGKLKAPQDDMDVFARLLDLELDDVSLWRYKMIGDWQVAYNAMRQLRPARASSQILNSIKQPFDENRFHFNKPFLKPEILWQGEYREFATRVLFNKFPFSDYHLLIVVSPEVNCPQLLNKQMHEYAFSLVDELATVFPGFGIGYNSLAAGASVNHFHFQGFIREQDFAIEKIHWSHHGGTVDYPLEVKCFTDIKDSWQYIEQLSKQDAAFNCIYRSGCCYVVVRQYQGTVELPAWLNGAGWLDVAGTITVSDEKTFNEIDALSITQALLSLF